MSRTSVRARWRFDAVALAAAGLIFVLLVLIATRWAHHPFVRGFLGDALAVAWVYFLFRTVLAGSTLRLATTALAVGCMVELGQYLASSLGLHLGNRVLRILLGSVPDWLDVLAYATGFVAVLVLEKLTRRWRTY